MDIQPVDGTELTPALFGAKASRLSEARAAGANIPYGYAISFNLVRRIMSNELTNADVDLLESVIHDVVQHSGGHGAILRSSSPKEGESVSRFSGEFGSVSGIWTLEQFLQAVPSCATSSYVEGSYPKVIPLLIQVYVPCIWSAQVAYLNDRYVIELYKGSLEAHIRGVSVPTVLHCRVSEQNSLVVDFIKNMQNVDNVRDVANRLVSGIPQILNSSTFEIAITDNDIILLQSQEFDAAPMSLEYLSEDTSTSIFPTKIESMILFKNAGLFSKRLETLRHGSQDRIHKIKDLISWKYPVTVRCSRGNQIGLPRYFPKCHQELIDTIKIIPHEYDVICHEYMDIKGSFEILIDENEIYLEHVPGMWESESTQNPDSISLNRDGSYFIQRYCFPRSLKKGIIDSPEQVSSASPVPEETLRSWVERVSEIWPVLRSILHCKYPLIVHFVEDELGSWQFLNVRPGYRVAKMHQPRRVSPLRVNCLADLDEWDHSTPILLTATSNRGNEGVLIPLAKRLAQIGEVVFAEFGLLSHPAMVMQAHGVQLAGWYRSIGDDGGYSLVTGKLDAGSDPIDRIFHEPEVVANDALKVVYDRKPIVPNHLVAVSKKRIRAFSSAMSIVEQIRKVLTLLGGSWFVFERGNALFCTSGLTDSHAHAHFLPLECFPGDIAAKLALALGAQEFSSIEDAWRAAEGCDDQYIVFGISNGPGFLANLSPVWREKKYVRRFLEANCGKN